MTTVTVSFKGTHEKILEEMVDLGIVKTRTEAIRVALLNFALTSGIMSKEKILGEIHKQAKSIRMNEIDLQRMIEHAKEENIH
ncbi:MAG: hypothetical protein U9N09_08775 [Euryarchaeota archaeon]|nr:hypothetical protein [Euryarchaeota archaeon]